MEDVVDVLVEGIHQGELNYIVTKLNHIQKNLNLGR